MSKKKTTAPKLEAPIEAAEQAPNLTPDAVEAPEGTDGAPAVAEAAPDANTDVVPSDDELASEESQEAPIEEDEKGLVDTLADAVTEAANKVRESLGFVRETKKVAPTQVKRRKAATEFKASKAFGAVGPELPTDVYGVTTELRKAMTTVASRIRGDETKYSIVKETIKLLQEYIDEKFVEDSRSVTGSLSFVREKVYADIAEKE